MDAVLVETTNNQIDAAFIAYVSKVIYYKAIRLSKKYRKRKDQELLTLDANIGDEKHCFKDLIPNDRKALSFPSTKEDFWRNLTDDLELHRAVGELTNSQKDILKAVFIDGTTEKEYAIANGISQQAVSKTKQRALNKLRSA